MFLGSWLQSECPTLSSENFQEGKKKEGGGSEAAKYNTAENLCI